MRLGVAMRGLSRVVLAVLALATAQVAGAAEPAQIELGRKLFTQLAVPACALCHTLKAAGSEGAVGPVLDELQPDAARVATALRNGIGAMPSYRATLSEAQIQALAAFVSTASGGAK